MGSGRIDDIKGIALAARGISEALDLILQLCQDSSVKLQTLQLRRWLSIRRGGGQVNGQYRGARCLCAHRTGGSGLFVAKAACQGRRTWKRQAAGAEASEEQSHVDRRDRLT
ncbi:hypothetical protein PsorP6_002239 [Peronosclerospora sorghi]|uniref:Uncharacterized protein n=1 Tax=Peronosclerospora sorghi TaxID=230839 RepID=A0ACC0WPB5_9STRA|nr:hypothetical protein PsorP6_002239 [Peronosclerospora sorghi]